MPKESEEMTLYIKNSRGGYSEYPDEIGVSSFGEVEMSKISLQGETESSVPFPRVPVYRFWCDTCEKPIEDFEVKPCISHKNSVVIVCRCHGQMANMSMSSQALKAVPYWAFFHKTWEEKCFEEPFRPLREWKEGDPEGFCDTSLAKKTTDELLLEQISEVQFKGGWGLVAELMKRYEALKEFWGRSKLNRNPDVDKSGNTVGSIQDCRGRLPRWQQLYFERLEKYGTTDVGSF